MRAHVERVLGAQITRVGGVDLAAGHIVVVFALQGHDLRFSEHRPGLGNVILPRFDVHHFTQP